MKYTVKDRPSVHGEPAIEINGPGVYHLTIRGEFTLEQRERITRALDSAYCAGDLDRVRKIRAALEGSK